MPKKKRAAGYIRVSSARQKDNTSLGDQEKAIRQYAKDNDLKVKVYSEAKSGASMEKRSELLRLLRDAADSKFDVMVCDTMDRFGRDLRDILNNRHTLSECGVEEVFLKEQGESKLSLNIKGAIAEDERDRIRRRTLRGRISKGKKGFRVGGGVPFGRTYDKKTGEWGLDERKAKLIKWAADAYLSGTPLKEITQDFKTKHNTPLSYQRLITVLTERSGDTWTINFKDQDPIVYNIPRLLSDQTIEAVKRRLKHNRKWNRHDARKYLLTGFIRCSECGRALTGQTTKDVYTYYRHETYFNKSNCKAFTSIPGTAIEDAVFKTIFENVMDEPAFNEAIRDSLPDREIIESLKKKISDSQKELKKVDKELEKLVDLALKGTLKPATIKKREADLYDKKDKLTEGLEKDQTRLRTLPNPEEAENKAKKVRMALSDYFGSEERLNDMTFDEKKRLLHWLFDGLDEDGEPLGIYVAKRPDGSVRYTINASLIYGTRVLKGEDIDYYDDYEQEYLENLLNGNPKKGPNGLKPLKGNQNTHYLKQASERRSGVRMSERPFMCKILMLLKR